MSLEEEHSRRYVGIDVGDSRIGLSISDGKRMIAFPLAVIKRENNSYGFKKMEKLLKERDIEAFVVGLPVQSDGSMGNQCEKVLNYVESLKKYFKSEVIVWDERYTTVIAEKILIETNTKREKRRKVVDEVAAQLILQSYMDYLNKSEASK